MVYAAFTESTTEVIRRLTWAKVLRSDTSADQPPVGQVAEAAVEALQATAEAIALTLRRAEEVLLVTESRTVMSAVQNFMAAISSFDLNASSASTGTESDGYREIAHLGALNRRFTTAAREELGIAQAGLPLSTSGVSSSAPTPGAND